MNFSMHRFNLLKSDSLASQNVCRASILQYYSLSLINVTGIIYEADHTYSIWSTWLCDRLVQCLTVTSIGGHFAFSHQSLPSLVMLFVRWFVFSLVLISHSHVLIKLTV